MPQEYMDERSRRRRRANNSNAALIGTLFLLIGGALFLRQAGVDLPYWLFQWEMILIVIGTFIGFKDGFRNLTWVVLISLGLFFLLDDFIPDLRLTRFILPVIFLAVGIIIISGSKPFTRRSSAIRQKESTPETGTSDILTDEVVEGIFPTSNSTDNRLDVASVFANVRKTILSKNFKGGEIVAVFGGADINLTRADFQHQVEIEAVNIFGGTKLLIPSSWEIKSEIVSIFGGMEDKRHFPSVNVVPEKTIILKGVCIFGGIEIKN